MANINILIILVLGTSLYGDHFYTSESDVYSQNQHWLLIKKLFGYERVYLPLCEVADPPFHIQRS